MTATAPGASALETVEPITKISELRTRLAAVAPSRLNYNHVMVFLDVAQAGSINGAADVRCVAQSAVSRIVRELELSLQTPLLLRHARGIELTEAGRILAELARKIRAEGNSACRDLALVRAGSRPLSLAVGVPPGLVGFIPPALGRFAQRVPGCRIVLREGPKDILFAAVGAGELDAVVCRVGNDELPEGLTEEFIYRDALVVLASRDYRTADSGGLLTAADVHAGSWVLPPPDSAPYKDVVATLHALRLEMPAAKIETTSSMLIKELLLTGHDWLAVMPRGLFRAELRARQLQILGKPTESIVQPMGVVLRRRASTAEAGHIELFIECLTQVSAAGEVRKS
ncbi:MAG: LysR family transcriptional regulator [Gammaproteobacteria bacterium]|nr:LysR family transcriptional regulator [Gammaproteobacteria bacterium]